MAWVAIENFNSYADGDLAGETGGSGWNGAWVNGLTQTMSVTAVQEYEGAKGVLTNHNVSNTFYYRLLTSAISTNGNVVYFAMRKSLNNSGEVSCGLRSSSGSRLSIAMNASGNITLGGSTSVTLVSGFTVDTWYVFRLTFNVVAGTATAAVSTAAYGGTRSWGSESSSVTMASSGDIDRFQIQSDANAGTSYIDYISPIDPTGMTAGIISYYKLDESSGNAADSAGTNTLTNNNTTTFVAGKVNNAADLERSSSQDFSIADGSQIGLDLTGEISIAAWIKLESDPTTNTYAVVAKFSTMGNRQYQLSIGDSDKITFAHTVGGVTESKQVTWDPSTAVFYHLGVSFASNGDVKFYVNGAQQGATQSGLTAGSDNGSSAFRIGGNDTGLGEYFDGLIDEVGVWDRALTDAEFTSLYSGGSGNQYPFSSIQNLTLTAAQGSYTITGQDVTLRRGKALTAALGTYVVTGFDVILRFAGWEYHAKNTSTYSNGTKHSASWGYTDKM